MTDQSTISLYQRFAHATVIKYSSIHYPLPYFSRLTTASVLVRYSIASSSYCTCSACKFAKYTEDTGLCWKGTSVNLTKRSVPLIWLVAVVSEGDAAAAAAAESTEQSRSHFYSERGRRLGSTSQDVTGLSVGRWSHSDVVKSCCRVAAARCHHWRQILASSQLTSHRH